jgi:hypothetical protein
MLKSRINTAVAASLLGLAAVSTQVQAIDVSRNNIGQALVYPYYTVNGGWITTFNVINTSDKTLAVKVRFHELKNSRDVLDFNIVLSPYDTWTGWVQDSDLGPELKTVDRSCTSPLDVRDPTKPVNASRVAYTGVFDDTGGQGFNRMREGYVEVLLMGEAPAGLEECDPASTTACTPPAGSAYVPWYAKHVDGEPRDCAKVDAAFIANAPSWNENIDPATAVSIPAIDNSLPGSGDPLARNDFIAPSGNWLKGNVGWLDAATGYGAGSEAVAIEDWAQDNYVTAQQFPWFLEPTFATGPTLWTVTGVAAFESVVGASATVNEWANNPNNGARSDWVVTFPTKAYHVDQFNDQIQAAVSKYRNGLTDVVTPECDTDRTDLVCDVAASPTTIEPFESLFGAELAADGTGVSPITVLWDYFDREEGRAVQASEGTSISPAPPTPRVDIELNYEANVVTFASSSVLDSNFAASSGVGEALPFATSGWARLSFSEALNPTTNLYELPAAAFAVRTIDRTLDGQAYDSGYLPPSATQPQPVQ